ncbi:winged helix DNA-binding domain-containing protein [Cryobacterium zhongshanensis]|uniref:Winged helix DNA-binding domain-containing protein n=1 Tax=Cryobacterium zhongshanensis TaxID=2928153 RepID=A0AA41UGM8_9MICO|nr:winged helix DNA-binding domain-containing protein [Cryobacterium zhongshanensis]MCI4657489.1 winged helix DNA-binding domain-containing protein [Cryobacterium zhongshanensis]
MSTRASRSDVLRLRLLSHGLSATATATAGLGGPLAVVERMLAVQAQDLPAASWAIGVRSPGTVAADVTAALDAGSIVRSYPMRGTLHLVPATDVRWLLDLTAERVLSSLETRQRQLGLDATIVASAAVAATDLLSGGRHLSRTPFLAGLRSAGIDPDGQRGYHLIVSLALAGLVAWGPNQDGQPALALLDEWAPVQRRLDRAEGLAEFLVRYLDGHGPATLRDFVAWTQLTVSDARVALAEAGDRLEELEVDGESLLLPVATERGVLGSRPAQRSPVLALPGFDEYLLGYRDRSYVVANEDFPRVVPGLNGIFLPLIVADGRVIGTWRKQTTRTRSAGPTVAVEAAPFSTLSARRSTGFARAIRDYSRFTGIPTTVTPPVAPPGGAGTIS